MSTILDEPSCFQEIRWQIFLVIRPDLHILTSFWRSWTTVHRVNRLRSRCKTSCRQCKETLFYSTANQERQKQRYQFWELPHELNRSPVINSALMPHPDIKWLVKDWGLRVVVWTNTYFIKRVLTLISCVKTSSVSFIYMNIADLTVFYFEIMRI